MYDTKSDILSVPDSEATVLQLRYTSGYDRNILLRNLTSSVLTIKIQEYDGSSWENIGAAISLGVAGGGSDVEEKHITSGNILRIVGSGGSSDRDLFIAVSGYLGDGDEVIWSSPLV